jgi:hypothetical protein
MVEQAHGLLRLPMGSLAETATINQLLVQNGIGVYLLQPQQNDLEQLFMDITSDKQ